MSTLNLSSREENTEESRKTETAQDYRGMGLLALKRLVSMKLEQKRSHGRSQSHSKPPLGLSANLCVYFCSALCISHLLFSRYCYLCHLCATDGSCRQDDNSHGGKKARYLCPELPEVSDNGKLLLRVKISAEWLKKKHMSIYYFSLLQSPKVQCISSFALF